MLTLRKLFVYSVAIMERIALMVWGQQTSSPITPSLPTPLIFNDVVNGSVFVSVGETIRVKEDMQVIINCSHLIDAVINNGTSNHNVTWLKDGIPITNESTVNTVITADNKFCIIYDTVLAGDDQVGSSSDFGTGGNYTCEVCNVTTCVDMTSPQIVCDEINISLPSNGNPVVIPDFIRLQCGQDVTVTTLMGKHLEMECIVSSGLEPLSLEVFKDGVNISDNFSLNFESPDDDDFGTYTFVASTDRCGHDFAVSRIVRVDETCQPVTETCVTEFYSFGLSEADTFLNNLQVDVTSDPIMLSENFYFYDEIITIVYVGDNGIISLNISHNPYEPQSIPLYAPRFIAPYWCDVDLRGTGNVFYRQTKDPALLARATNEIRNAFPSSQNVTVTNLLIVTWDAVGYYNRHTDKTNTYQCVLATSATKSFVIFLYSDGGIQWTTGDIFDGVGGLGGTEALAGISIGGGINITIPGSLTPNIINISKTSNVDIPGIWMFELSGEVAVRLVNGPNKYEGRVEVYYRGTWGTVCDDEWGLNDAQVVCRQLGFGIAINASGAAFYGKGSGQIWIGKLNCDGTELSIANCSHNGWGIHNCDHGEDAGVKCAVSNVVTGTPNATGTPDVTGTPADNMSDRSNSLGMIVGIIVGVIILIAVIAILLCLFILKKRRSRANIVMMKTSGLELNPLNNPTYNLSIITSISKQQISIDEWKKQLATYLIDHKSLDIKESIASGKFGIVYKAYYTPEENTVTEVAVKTIKSFSSSTAEDFIKECNISKKFDHPNVLSLIGVCIIPEESVPLMVMPFMHHGDVKSFLKSKRGNDIKVEEFPQGLNEEILTKMCLDIAKGMEYLAMRHYVHRDLAARNCMLDQSMTVKVADFGLSRDVYVTDYYTMSHSVPLPVKWLAPEALFDRVFSEKTDVWAFGVTCWEVFTLGLTPYPLIGISEIGDYIKNGKILDKPQLSSVKMYKMMKSCWKFGPEERPDFSELVKEIDSLKNMPQKKPMLKKLTTAYLPLFS